jgi:hypothetical protein
MVGICFVIRFVLDGILVIILLTLPICIFLQANLLYIELFENCLFNVIRIPTTSGEESIL